MSQYRVEEVEVEDSFASDRARQQMLTPIIYHETNSKDNIVVFSLLLFIRIQHLLFPTKITNIQLFYEF